MDPLQNLDPKAPLVSIVVAMHEGDYKYWPRALEGILAQDIPHNQMEVAIAYDGPVTEEITEEIVDAGGQDIDIPCRLFASLETEEPTGYYTVPRNRVMMYLLGYYIANLDVDNHWRPSHLRGLLTAIRNPAPDGSGWPHFVYSRRRYVADDDCTEELVTMLEKKKLIDVDSPLTPWESERVAALIESPQGNFVDTSDFLVSKSALYALAEQTGSIWNTECHRYGDWELVRRMALAGFRGLAVDQVTHVYHWTGKNVQLTRPSKELVPLPEKIYRKLVEEGKIVVN